MFFTLLIVTFLIALVVSFGVVRLFDRPVASILRRIVAEELNTHGRVQPPRMHETVEGLPAARGPSLNLRIAEAGARSDL